MKILPLRSCASRPLVAGDAAPAAPGRWPRWGACSLALALAACASPPPRPPVHRHPPAASARPLYFYPQQGQGERRQDRDRYECYQWASRQTRSDPGMTPLRTYVQPAPAPDPALGRDTAVGALGGAMIGGAVASRHHTAEGAAVGLVLGALIGAASDQARADAARQAQADARYAVPPWHDFRRAMSACMAGRGYTVG